MSHPRKMVSGTSTITTGSFYLGSSSFSVYEEMSRQLLSHYFMFETDEMGGDACSHPDSKERFPDGEQEKPEEKMKKECLENTCTASSSPALLSEEKDMESHCGERQKSESEDKSNHDPNDTESTTTTAASSNSLMAPSAKEGRRPEGSMIKWVKRTSKAHLLRCDVVLGDRFDISYAALRCAPLSSLSIFGGIRWVNYFQGSDALTLKASMTHLLNTEECKKFLITYFPPSFVLGGDVGKRKDERDAFLAAVREGEEAYAMSVTSTKSPSQKMEEKRDEAVPEDPPSRFASSHSPPLWILKPSAGAKGSGIQIVQGVEAAKRFIDVHLAKQYQESGKKAPRWMAQSYLLRPLLLPGRRKFDIRIWVLLQSPYSIYAYSKGSCRTTSVPYDVHDIFNTLSHLTNHCLQEGTEGFGRYEEGNEMFFPALSEFFSKLTEQDGHYYYLEKEREKEGGGMGIISQGIRTTEGSISPTATGDGESCPRGPPHPGVSNTTTSSSSSSDLLSQVVWPQIATIVTRTLLLMKDPLQLLQTDESNSFRCFQLFGYDFMLDDTLQVKLLEINGSPGLAEKYLSPVVREMIQRLYTVSSSFSTSKGGGKEKEGDDGVQYPLLFRTSREKRTTTNPSVNGEEDRVGTEKEKGDMPKPNIVGEDLAGLPSTFPLASSVAHTQDSKRERKEEKTGGESKEVKRERQTEDFRFMSSSSRTTADAVGARQFDFFADREWSLEKDKFILLWKGGEDAMPEGLKNSG